MPRRTGSTHRLPALVPVLLLLAAPDACALGQEVPFIRGDANGDGALAIVDPIFALGYLFSGGAVPPCLDAADADDNGALNIVDPIFALTYLFAGGPPPNSPFPACGTDPTPDGIGCAGPVPGCPANQAPTILSTPPATATEGVPFSYDVDATDPDPGDLLVYSLPIAPGGATIDPTTGAIAWTPDGGQTGPQSFAVRATDLGGLFDEQAFEVQVAAQNDAPAITSAPPLSATEGVEYLYDVAASDPDAGDAVLFTLPTAPAGAGIDPASGLISWTPDATQIGANPFVVRATDLGGLFAEQGFAVTVLPAVAGGAPTIGSIPPTYVWVWSYYSYSPTATDPEQDPIVWSLEQSPPGVSVDPFSGSIFWSPTPSDLGDHSFTLRATDPGGLFAEQTWTVHVVDSGNHPPEILSSPPTLTLADSFFTYYPSAQDADLGDVTTWSLLQGPAGASIDPAGALYWSPTSLDVGFHAFELRASDTGGLFADQAFTLEVRQNEAPVIISTPPADPVPLAQPFAYPAIAFDPYPATVFSWSLPVGPPGAWVDFSSGVVTWTPTAPFAGPNDFTVRVTDDLGLFSEQSFVVTVLPPTGQPPVIVSTPPTLAATGALYSYTVAVDDPDAGDTVAFSLTSSPSGAWIAESTGIVSWTPQAWQVGAHSFTVRATDSEGLFAEQSFGVTVETGFAPVIVSTPATSATEALLWTYDVEATDANAWQSLEYSLPVAPAGAAIGGASGLIQWVPGREQPGLHAFTVRVTDSGGVFAEQSFTVDVADVEQPPQIVSEPPLQAATGVPSIYRVVWADPDSAAATVSIVSAPAGATLLRDDEIHWTPTVLGPHLFTVRVTDPGAAFSEQSYAVNVIDGSQPPPDPATVAPPLPTTEAAIFSNAVAFLFEGANPIQVGASPGIFEPERICVLRGEVRDAQGLPLAQVVVRAHDRPEYGTTRTRADGGYDLAVNGGEEIVLEFVQPGYLPAQRAIATPWLDYRNVDPVRLVALDAAVTTVDLSQPVQTARGSVVADADGIRRSTTIFPGGTTATMVLPDGTTQPLAALSFRATEYTVGPGGPQAMPGDLPTAVGYTYCVELSVDEAIAAGATTVEFSQPVHHYVENFLGFPVGSPVPVGWYDREAALWRGSPDGRVIAVTGVDGGGRAEIDIDGSGTAASPAELAALGFTDAERTELALLYSVGQELWRAPVPHFTPFDCNWPFGPVQGAEPPGEPDPQAPGEPPVDKKDKKKQKDCEEEGSIIAVGNQILAEEVEIPGTPITLRYASDRVPGRTSELGLRIRVTNSSVPASLLAAEVSIDVCGQAHRQTFTGDPGHVLEYQWDGSDAYGRPVLGTAVAKVTITHDYPVEYRIPGASDLSWGRFFPGSVALASDRTPARISRSFHIPLSRWIEREQFGGWRPTIHHAFDPERQVLIDGRGIERGARVIGNALEHFAGDGGTIPVPDGPDARLLGVNRTRGLAADARGDLFVSFTRDSTIKRIRPDRSFSTIAGIPGPGISTLGHTGDGGPATDALITALDVAADGRGNLYIAGYGQNHLGASIGDDYASVRRIDAGGTITTIAGGVNIPPGGTQFGEPAVGNRLFQPAQVAAAPDGCVYFASNSSGYVHVILPNGILEFVPNSFAAHRDLAVDGQGRIYSLQPIPMGTGFLIRRLSTDGTWSTLVGGGAVPAADSDGLPGTDLFLGLATALAIDAEDRVHWIDATFAAPWEDYFHLFCQVRRLEHDGTVRTLAGRVEIFPADGITPQPPVLGIGGLARNAWLPSGGNALTEYNQIAIGPDGTLFIESDITVSDGDPDRGLLLRTRPSLGVSGGPTAIVASEDGHEAYSFSPEGRHLATFDLNTRATRFTFGYDAEGRLTTVTDRNGRVTTIDRDATGRATQIVSPDGEVTGLGYDAAGYLSSIALSGGRTFSAGYTVDGLLTSFTWPGGHHSTYGYDPLGRLVAAANDTGMSQTFVRTELPTGSEVLHATAEGRTTMLRVEALPDRVRRTRIDPGGNSTVHESFPDGSELLTLPDGSTIEQETVSDPRFGPQVLLLSRGTVTMPDGSSSTITRERDVLLENPDDPLSLALLTDTFTRDGEVWSHVVDPIAGTYRATSPEGRELVTTFDALGRTVSRGSDPAFFPLAIAYDAAGRPATMGTGPQAKSYAYDAQGRLATRTYAGGAIVDYGYDAFGNIAQVTLPSGRVLQYVHDANGWRTAVTLPGGQTHVLGRDPRGRLESWTAPGNAPWTRIHDLDGALVAELLPSGRVRDYGHDGARRIESIVTPEAAVSFGYPADGAVLCCGNAGRPISLLRTPVGPGSVQAIAAEWNGSLLENTTFSGAAAGVFSYGYDAQLRLASIALDGVPILDLARDAQGALTAIGPFLLENTGPDGATSVLDDGAHEIVLAYDALRRIAERTHWVGGLPLYSVEIGYDLHGRVTTVGETIEGIFSETVLSYDPDQQLVAVTRDGALAESYAYDLNGNRTSAAIGAAPAEVATFDPQDRIVQLGATAYAFDADGMLLSRGGDAFVHGALGELLSATVGGTTVIYSSDAIGRRTARTVGADTWQYLYGDPGNPWRLTASRDPAGVLTTYIHDESGILIAIERGGVRYAVLCDPVGTPRLVAAPDGTVVKRLEHTAFGVRTLDTDPGFELAIGFAGGIHDPLTGLVRFGLRDLDPAAGRFTTRDPLLFSGGQANLYAYAGNDPIGRRDESGLFSIGFSGYAGVGGGAKLSWEPGKGFSVCAEVGLGGGGGFELDLDGKVDGDKDTVGAELSVEVGPIGAGAKWELDDCGNMKLEAKGKIGPAEFSTDGEDKLAADPLDFPDLLELMDAALDSKVKIQGKVAAQSCRGFGG